MSRSRGAISLWLVCHIVSLSVHAVPPVGGASQAPTAGRTSHDRLSRVISPVADMFFSHWGTVHGVLWRATTSWRRATSTYVESAGLQQRWTMFTVPARALSYLRARFYWISNRDAETAGRTLSATGIVYPLDRDDRAKLLSSFPNSFRGKAVSSFLQGYFEDLAAGREAEQRLQPLLSYFVRRFERQHLVPEERLSRAELWYGFVYLPEPGSRNQADQAFDHLDTLRAYYDGPRPVGWSRRTYAQRGAVEREADIVWTLLVADSPGP